jgi:hypothetical protein
MDWFSEASNAPRGMLLLIILVFLGMSFMLIWRAYTAYSKGFAEGVAAQKGLQPPSEMTRMLTNPTIVRQQIASMQQNEFVIDRVLRTAPTEIGPIKYAPAEPQATEKLTAVYAFRPGNFEFDDIPEYAPPEPDGVHVHERERPPRPANYAELSDAALEVENGDVRADDDLEPDPENPDTVITAFHDLPEPITEELPTIDPEDNPLTASDWLETQLAKLDDWATRQAALIGAP